MNDFMSGGLHRYWKDELLSMTGVGPTTKVLRWRATVGYGRDATIPMNGDTAMATEAATDKKDEASSKTPNGQNGPNPAVMMKSP